MTHVCGIGYCLLASVDGAMANNRRLGKGGRGSSYQALTIRYYQLTIRIGQEVNAAWRKLSAP